MNASYIVEQYEAIKRFGLYGLAAIGAFYLGQMLGLFTMINVVVPTEVVDDLPKAAVVKSR